MIITQTPLRISFAGGGTDLPSYYRESPGMVVSAALDKSVFVIVSPRYDRDVYVNYSRKEIVAHAADVHHELVREAMRLTGVSNGVEITMLSDIPSEGSGLGSSSSFTVGLLNALHAFKGDQVGAAQLAEEACEIEIKRCQKPIGKQDQYIAAFGGVTAFEFLEDERVRVEPLALTAAAREALESQLVLFYSNIARRADALLSEQNARAAENRASLDGIRQLALEARDAIRAGDAARLGAVLDRNWELKRKLGSAVTNGAIDEMYARAKAAGASGAKLCGAGGGGFLLSCVDTALRARLVDAMQAYRTMPVHIDPAGSRVILNYRRSGWS